MKFDAVAPLQAPGEPSRPDQVLDVVLHASDDERSALTALLQKFARRVISDQDDEASLSSSAAPLATVVSDLAAHHLDRCRHFAKSGPVILVSDKTGFDCRLNAARHGVTALVRRPVNPIEMSEWLQYFADRKSAEPFTVLIVDDDWLTAEVAAEVLRSDGISVVTVSDSTRALDAIEEQPPDLILMDIQMPLVDGVELTRVIRQSRQFFSVPIIFLSAERDEARQIEARRLGGDDFFQKPIVPDRLISLVRLRADRSKHLRSMIERDRLTGLYDPTAFRERLAHELNRCSRMGSELSLALIDLDHFKLVNDRYGHLSGDHVLRTLASQLTADLRGIDIVGRCGGEEFGVVLLDTGADQAAYAIDRVRQHFGQIAFGTADGPYNVTFSAGIACSRESGHQLTDILTVADKALYDCKRHGRNMVRTASNGTSSPEIIALHQANPKRTHHAAA